MRLRYERSCLRCAVAIPAKTHAHFLAGHSKGEVVGARSGE